MGASWVVASYVVSVLWPLVLLGVLFAVLRRLGAAFGLRDWSRATAFTALFATPLLFQFSLGRVDHHGFSAILVAAALGSVVRLMESPHVLKHALAAGFFLAFGQAVALETLPWLLVFSGWIGLWIAIKGRVAAWSGIVFGLSLYVFSALFLAATASPASFYAINLLSYSYLYVLIAGGIALGLAAVSFASFFRGAVLRAVVAILAPASFLAAFLIHFPALWQGPYGGMDPDLAKVILGHISEAVPLTAKADSWDKFVAFLAFVFSGLAVGFYRMLKAEGERVWPWLLSVLLQIAAIFLMFFIRSGFRFTRICSASFR
jgi:hypothetical protein